MDGTDIPDSIKQRRPSATRFLSVFLEFPQEVVKDKPHSTILCLFFSVATCDAFKVLEVPFSLIED